MRARDAQTRAMAALETFDYSEPELNLAVAAGEHYAAQLFLKDSRKRLKQVYLNRAFRLYRLGELNKEIVPLEEFSHLTRGHWKKCFYPALRSPRSSQTPDDELDLRSSDESPWW